MAYREQAVSFDQAGQRLHGFLHLPEGNGPHPAVVMLHGLGGSHIESHFLFTKTARALASAGMAALRFDFRGSGNSEGHFRDMTPRSEIDDVHSALAFLRAQPGMDAGRIAVLGLSMGGFVASFVASAGGITALVLWAAVADLGERIDARATPEREVALERYGFVDMGGNALGGEFIRQARVLKPLSALGSYTGPALIVHGSADESVPMEHAYRYRDVLMGRAELRVIEGADHVFTSLPWEQEVISTTVAWLRRRL